jgi:DNA-binding CsgD family transcriptional regulator
MRPTLATRSRSAPTARARSLPPGWVQGLLDAVGEVHAVEDPAAFRDAVLDALPRLLPCAYVSYAELGPDTRLVLTRPAMDPGPARRWARLIEEHARGESVVRGRPVRLSDRRVLSPLGLVAQVAFTLVDTPSCTVLIVLARRDRDFTDQEVELLAHARRHFIQAYRTAQANGHRASVLAALAQGLETQAEGVVVTTPAGEIAYSTPTARARLALDHDATTLPPHLRRQLANADADGAQDHLVVRGHEDRAVPVHVLRPPDDDLRILLLERPGPGPNITDLLARGLTPREAETLARIAGGHPRATVAEAMRISVRTVDKHLQAIYTKLGVRSQAEAVASAWHGAPLHRIPDPPSEDLQVARGVVEYAKGPQGRTF